MRPEWEEGRRDPALTFCTCVEDRSVHWPALMCWACFLHAQGALSEKQATAPQGALDEDPVASVKVRPASLPALFLLLTLFLEGCCSSSIRGSTGDGFVARLDPCSLYNMH